MGDAVTRMLPGRLHLGDGVGLAWVLLAVSLAAFSARSLTFSGLRRFPVFDEVSYIDLARDFGTRGPWGTIRCYYRGECREDNRHPLYPLLLSAWVDGGPADFAKAKLLSLACAMLLLTALFLFSFSLWGREVALLALAFLSLSPALAYLSRMVLADALFAALYCAALLGLQSWHGRAWGWFAFGLCCGGAYLAKPFGAALFFGALVFGLCRHRLSLFARKEFYTALPGFVLVAFFLLFRNIRVWGSPFHNVNNAAVWMDDIREVWLLYGTPEWDQAGLRWYFRNHGLPDAWRRLSSGAFRVASAWIDTLAVGPDVEIWKVLSGAGIFLLSLHGMRLRWARGARGEILAPGLLGLLLLLSFAWAAEPTHPDARFMMPIAACCMPFAAIGALDLGRRALPTAPRAPGPSRAMLVSIAASAGLLGVYHVGFGKNPRTLWLLSPAWADTSAWMEDRLGCAPFLVSARSLYSAWDRCPDRRLSYPLDMPQGKLADYVDRHGVDYALLDRPSMFGDPFREKYGPEDRHGPVSFLGWPRCRHDGGMPSLFLIYGRRCP